MFSKIFGKKKKKDEDDHLDVLDEIKEPFSMQRFIDEQIVERYNKFRRLLDEYGILFFLLSPFQYRNRLMIKIGIIILGVLIGLVPRSMSLVDEAKERNAASELAQIEGKEYRAGRITIRPLQSSQYDEQHLIVFEIGGDTVKGVPSTANKYQVDLKPDRGVSYAEDVRYAYDIIPVSNNSRLLVMYVDNREQDDETGIYSLHVRVEGDNIKYPDTMPIVLSDNQETNELFNSEGIDLAPLTTMVEPNHNDAIEKAEDKLDEYLKGYELLDERLNVENMVPGMTYEDMKEYVEKEMVLADIDDDSTVRDIKRDAKHFEPQKDDSGRDKILNIHASLTFQDESYKLSDKDIPDHVMGELDELQKLTNNITSELSSLNNVKIIKYDRLVDLIPVLNREIDVTEFAITDLMIVEPEEGETNEESEPKKKKKNLSDEILSDEDFINQE